MLNRARFRHVPIAKPSPQGCRCEPISWLITVIVTWRSLRWYNGRWRCPQGGETRWMEVFLCGGSTWDLFGRPPVCEPILIISRADDQDGFRTVQGELLPEGQ